MPRQAKVNKRKPDEEIGDAAKRPRGSFGGNPTTPLNTKNTRQQEPDPSPQAPPSGDEESDIEMQLDPDAEEEPAAPVTPKAIFTKPATRIEIPSNARGYQTPAPQQTAPQKVAAKEKTRTPNKDQDGAPKVQEKEKAKEKTPAKEKGKAKEVAPEPVNEAPKPDALVKKAPVFQFAMSRKEVPRNTAPVETFKIVPVPEDMGITFFNHMEPFKELLPTKENEPLSKEFQAVIANSELKVLATIIGTYKRRDRSKPLDKVTKVIERAAAFITKKRPHLRIIPNSNWLVIKVGTQEAVKALLEAQVVLSVPLQTAVVFRELRMEWYSIRSISISGLTSRYLFIEFDKYLREEAKVEVVARYHVTTPEEAAVNYDEKALWIVKPENPEGPLDKQVFPINGSSRYVLYWETVECSICKGGDHNASQCKWFDFEPIWTRWGETRDETKRKPLPKPAKNDDAVEDSADKGEGPSNQAAAGMEE
ncbi:hypothetical protein M413DRAFT_33070 [Hebeloma cylindrosporum]|uniref:Uncharacterized protein n=1 Tax=Hebeloma cylindrosporum TaxID=76867 RepID=A0A0C2Y0V2_HEBCY|nr:hypothetical protein M413DRAFT_33070 [Hebeloma cylindrosporum h7]